MEAFPPHALRAAFVAAATPYLRTPLPLEAVVAQVAALEAGELLALTRHLRPRLVPGEEPSAPAVAERIVQMDAAELRELGWRLQERLAQAAAEV